MGGLILGVNTLYRLFCFFKLLPVVGKELTLYLLQKTGKELTLYLLQETAQSSSLKEAEKHVQINPIEILMSLWVFSGLIWAL